MIFHSLDYLVFLLAVLGIYWCLRQPWQNRPHKRQQPCPASA